MTNDEGCLKQAEPEKNAANWDNFSASDKQWNNFSGLDEWQPGRPPSRHDVIQPLGGLRTQLCIARQNVYFVKYDVTVSFLAQVLDTVTYSVSHVLDSGYSDIFWHIL